jgi:hypothetical protein
MAVLRLQQQQWRVRVVRILSRIGLIFIGLILIYVLVGVGVYAVFGLESYFEPHPAIDTKFPAGYTEAGFDQIQIGDTHERVRELIGDPLERCSHGRSTEYFWCYSDDGGFAYWDFAWLYRAVSFDEAGRVRELYRDIFYD